MKKMRDDPGGVAERQALFVANHEPRQKAGELSEGMLFDRGHAEGLLPARAVPERPLPNGARAGWRP